MTTSSQEETLTNRSRYGQQNDTFREDNPWLHATITGRVWSRQIV